MGLFDFFKRTVGAKTDVPMLKTSWTPKGVRVEFSRPLISSTPEALLDAIHESSLEDSILGAYLAQLAIEGKCDLEDDGALIVWP